MPTPRKARQTKALDNNPGKKPLMGVKPPPGIPDRPAWLVGEGAQEWDRVVVQLDALGVLSPLHQSMLAAYCSLWGRYVQVVKELATAPLTDMGQKGETVKHPLLSVENQLFQRLHGYASLFGLSPGTAARLDVPDRSQDEDPHGILD